jgi:hypothetical protein
VRLFFFSTTKFEAFMARSISAAARRGARRCAGYGDKSPREKCAQSASMSPPGTFVSEEGRHLACAGPFITRIVNADFSGCACKISGESEPLGPRGGLWGVCVVMFDQDYIYILACSKAQNIRIRRKEIRPNSTSGRNDLHERLRTVRTYLYVYA